MGAEPAIGFAPMPAVARVLASYDRAQLASFIEVAIGLLDLAENDHEDVPDFRPRSDGMPGCPLSDGLETTGDEEEGAWVEWTSKPANLRRTGQHEIAARHEDDEDDDPDTGVEDGPRGFDPEEDTGADDLGEPDGDEPVPDYPLDQTKGPLPPHLAEDRELMAPHLRRVRRERCDRIRSPWGGGVEYRLREPVND